MKICRFGEGRLGVVEGDDVVDVTHVLNDLPALNWPFPAGDHFVANLGRLMPALTEAVQDGGRLPMDAVTLLSPVANPAKIIGAPVNYALHIDEANADANISFGTEIKSIHHYGLFLKATSALVGPSEGVVADWTDRRIDHEIELAVVIGQTCRNVEATDAMGVVAGYAIGLDMTVRGTEDRSLRKSLDSFAVLGPWVVTADEFGDPADIGFELTIGGETRQRASTKELVLNVPELIAYASKAYTLHPGDILMTGTPAGVGPVVPGDVMVCRMDRIGSMSVPVR